MQKLSFLTLISKYPRKIASQTFRSNHHHHGYTTNSQALQPTKLLLNPVFLKRVLPDTLLKLKFPSKILMDHGEFWILTQFRKHSVQSNRLISYQRTWVSEMRRRLTTDGVVISLIVTNVAVFLLWKVADRKFMIQNFMVQLDNFKSGRLHTMITSAFSHYELGHLISNMIGLYFFGKSIGRNLGPEYLLKLYLAGAFAGSVFYLLHHAFMAMSSKDERMSNVPGLGSSGAVTAIMLLDILLFPTKTIYLEFIIPVPAFFVGILVVGHDIVRMLQGDSQISGFAHLGGTAVAILAWARLRKGRF